MSAEIWTIIAVGVALAGLQWRMHVSLSAGLNGRMDRIEARIESRFAVSIRALPVSRPGLTASMPASTPSRTTSTA